MFAPSKAAVAAARYTQEMLPFAGGDGFDRGRAHAAILRLVRELEAARQPPAAIVGAAVDLLPTSEDAPASIWTMSLRDWVRTTARSALAESVLDRRHDHRHLDDPARDEQPGRRR